MSSTNIFSGINEGRNSSRVLRPPGGGQTDILGLSANPEPVQVKKPNPRNVSSILEGTNVKNAPAEVAPELKKPAEQAPVPVQAPQPESKKSTPETETAPSAKPEGASRPPVTDSANQRGRVPPGGFSSGLW